MHRMNTESKFARGLSLAIASLFVAAGTVCGQEATSLVVNAVQHSAEVGQHATFDVKLMNAAAQPAPAAKNLRVTLEIVSPSGKTRSEEIAIKAGEKEVRYQLPITEAGVFEVRARNRELLSGADIVQTRAPVRAPKVEMIAPPAAPPPASQPSPSASVPTAHEVVASRAVAARMAPAFRRSTATRSLASALPAHAAPPMPVPGSPATVTSSPPPAAAAVATPGAPLQKLEVDLRYSPQRRFLANGKDSAKIFALVHGAAPQKDTQLFLFNSSGSLAPKPLVIKKGEPLGEAELTSDQIGKVKLDYTWTDGWVDFDGARELSVEFAPPITQLRFQASPPDISLFDDAELIVKLTDDNGTPIATDIARRIAFSIDDGHGAFVQREINIPPGHSEGSTKFLPIASGEVKLTASSEQLRDQPTTVSVTWPVLLLGLAIIGGLIGGLLAFGTRRTDPALRILGGLVIGPLLVWVSIVGILPHASLPRPLLLNPFGAFFVAVLGGWIGTEIFTPIVKALFGIEPKADRP